MSAEISPDSLMFLRDCRQRINALAYRAQRLDNKRSPNVPGVNIVRNCLMHAQREGFSGEDTMTLIAFEALKALENMSDAYMVMLNSTPMHSMVMPKGDGHEGG